MRLSAALPLAAVLLPLRAAAPTAFPDAFGAALSRHGMVGGGYAIVRAGKLADLRCFGEARRETHAAAGPDTAWHWASITKTLTAIAILQLRDRGKLALDDPIVGYVPELRAVHDPYGPIDAVTIRHLLTHSAGFRGPTFPWGGDQPWHPFEPAHWSQIVAMLPYTEILFAPGSRHRYSNLGIVFLGQAIERLSGDDYEVYIDKNILKPLGMHHSYFDRAPYHLLRHRAGGYYRNAKGLTAAPFDFDTGVTVSNGGLNAPLSDMARYLEFLAGGAGGPDRYRDVLPRATLEEMWRAQLAVESTDASQGGVAPGRDSIGLGFFLHEAGGRRWIGHGGEQGGFVSHFFVDPARGDGHILVCNTDITEGRPQSAAVLRELENLLMK
jgi:CubicO group peptidase (beta-lactamase class C family)